jgi:long-chain acyl-CoA synthetase
MSNKHAVVQKFWSRVFNSPEAPALLIKNPQPEPVVVVVPSAIHPAVAVVNPPAYVEVSHNSSGLAVAAIAAYLHKSGFKAGDRAAIMAWNCPEWVLADLAIQSLGGVTVPVYPHSTPDQVNYVLRDSGALFLFSNEEAQLAKVDPTAATRAVHFDDLPELLTGVRPTERKSFLHNFLSPTAMQTDNAALWCAAHAQTRWFERALTQKSFAFKGNDVATIIYTSGSTGVPKGVVLTHDAFSSACEGMLGHGFVLDPRKDVYLSYLPLAHVYERAAGMMLCLWTGVPMAFCKVDEVGEALKQVKPTLLHGVPAVWRKVKDKIDANIMGATGIKKKLIDWAFAQGDSGFKHWIADTLVFGKIRRELGGRLRICTSGGAPISPEILSFYAKVGINVLQGYGLTETTGAAAVNKITTDGGGNKVGSVGPALNTIEVRIVPLPGQELTGEGEIQFRGTAVTLGYWNLPAETAKSFTEDGWFKTGDKGRMDKDGFLYITGRIKRLLKTDQGKYVAPEKIEKAFESDPIVQYVVPVGDGKPYIAGLIFVNQLLAREALTKQGVAVPDGDAAGFIAAHPLVRQAVEAAVAAANAKLERWEQLKKFEILPVEAGIPNGLLTPTLKIRTEEVLKRFADQAAAFYAKPTA